MIKKLIDNPTNIRILRENAISGIFVFLLLGLIVPFNVEEIQHGRIHFCLSMGIITTLVGIVISIFVAYVLKRPMDPTLPLASVHRNSVIHYLLNIPILAAALVSFAGYYLCGHVIYAWMKDGHLYLKNYTDYLYYVSSTSVFMFIGTYVRNRNWYLKYKYDEVSAINALLEKRQQELMRQEEKEEVAEEYASPTCTIKGSTAQSVLEVNPRDILYVESMSNYADIWYIDQDQPRHKTMRITLKQIMESLADEDCLVQCHRAFIVNLNFVITMSNRNTGYQLQIFGTDKPIPVSRTFTPHVKERLQNNKPQP